MEPSPLPGTAADSALKGLKSSWRRDVGAGFLVFLIALPLCLGVSVASGFPPMAGILSAVVGGLLVSRINGSHLAITGPAAGLVVVILGAVESLGEGDVMAGYRRTLGAIVAAGAIQVLMGSRKAGRLAAFFPASVVHGMLAAIGIIIMVKQIPVMAGVGTGAGATILGDLIALPHALAFFIPETAFIALAGLAILAGWPLVTHRLLRKVPAPILVILSGMALGQFFGLANLHPGDGFIVPKDIHVGPDFLVVIPDSLAASLFFPDFSRCFTLVFWQSVIAICLVGSLETLLCAAAVDKLDPRRRQTDLNRDLWAVGIGNVIAGLIGGLPMIVEVVRSSANVDAGAESGWSNFFHAAFLLLFVMAFSEVIDIIPLASLAALLVYSGYRLASPMAFARTMDLGREQLVLFVITIVGVLATNLLAGVLIGVAAKLALHVGRGVPLRNLLAISYQIEHPAPGTCVVRVQGSAIFSNFLALKSELAEFPAGKSIVFDLADAYLIDHTVMEFIEQFREDTVAQGGHCEIRGMGDHEASSEHELAARINRPQA